MQDRTGWIFLQAPTNLPLYVYEPASAGQSTCSASCEQQWIPLLAPAGERPVGEWTILVRKDGRRQWAFDQYPVYTYLHDEPDRPSGNGADGGAWRLLQFSG